jgi:hypothetical protein
MKHEQIPESVRPFLERAVESANEHCGWDFKRMQEAIKESDVALAVWQDAIEPGGVGFLLVKGQRFLSAIVSGGATIASKTVGIPCIDAEQAHAVRQVAGERGWLN